MGSLSESSECNFYHIWKTKIIYIITTAKWQVVMEAIWSAIWSYTERSSAVSIIKSNPFLEKEKDKITWEVFSPTMNLWKLWKLAWVDQEPQYLLL